MMPLTCPEGDSTYTSGLCSKFMGGNGAVFMTVLGEDAPMAIGTKCEGLGFTGRPGYGGGGSRTRG